MGPRRAAGKAVARSQVFDWLVRLAGTLDPARPDILPVLTYHRVAEPDDLHYPGLISATPAEFENQVATLSRTFSFVGLTTLLDRQAGGPPIPPRSIMLTFDDAYRDFADHAWPVLRRSNVPAVLFVPTAFPDRPIRFWWDRLYAALVQTKEPGPLPTAAGPLAIDTRAERLAAYRALRGPLKQLPHVEAMAEVDRLVERLGVDPPGRATLGWADLRGLQGEGVTLAPHSRTHPLLDRIGPAELDDEIAGSVADLGTQTGVEATAFAFPSGNYSDAVVARTRASGIKVAFTTVRGVNDLRRADWLTLRRINVGGRSSPALIRAQSLGAWAR